MSKIVTSLGLIGLVLAFVGGAMTPASASGVELAAQKKKRPQVTIYPRRAYPGPNAKRQCRSWLTKEYRVSGPVIVPQMRCWWE